jgi:signal transduction histidine kinase
VDAQPVPLTSVVADAVATVRRTWPDPDVVSDVPADLVVLADRDRLAQAVDNLLSNALRHGAPPVRVSARRVPNRVVEIRVSDQGGGVAETVRPRLFQRYAPGRNKGSTGLGLFIVRELARAHGGEAVYEPPSEDAPGGAFVIQLPEQLESVSTSLPAGSANA